MLATIDGAGPLLSSSGVPLMEDARTAGSVDQANNDAGFISACLMPEGRGVSPALTSSLPTLVQAEAFSLSFVPNDSALQTPFCKTTSGYLLWQPLNGIDCLVHHTRVPALAAPIQTYHYNDTDPLGNAHPWNNINMGLNVPERQRFASLNITAPIGIPYAAFSRAQLSINKRIVDKFSRARTVAGIVTLTSDTVSIGNTALSGRLGWGIVSDTRDVCQGDNGAFDTNDINNLCVSTKDSKVVSPLNEGAVMLLGNDIQERLEVPSFQRRSYVDGEWVGLTVDPTLIGLQFTMGGNPTGGGAPNSGYLMDLYMAHISPWKGVTANWNTAAVATMNPVGVFQNFTTDPIDETGVLQTKVRMRIIPNNGAGMTTCEFNCTYTHTFLAAGNPSTATADGSIAFTTVSGQRRLGVTTSQFFNSEMYLDFVLDPSEDRNSYIEQGKFISTSFNIHCVSVDSNAGNTGPFTVGSCEVKVCAKTVGRAGCVGPARLLVYEGVSNETQISIGGKMQVECVPEAQIAQFAREAIANQPRASTLEAMVLLNTLFNSPTTPIYRMLTNQMYKKFLMDYFGKLTAADIGRWVKVSGDAKLALAADASGLSAGFFDDIPAYLGSLGRAAAAGAGRAAVEHAFGAAGRFRAAGQFGSGGLMDEGEDGYTTAAGAYRRLR